MRLDKAKLDRRIYALKESAKRRNEWTSDDELAEFLSISSSTIRHLASQRKLHTMRLCDIAILEKLAGESINLLEM